MCYQSNSRGKLEDLAKPAVSRNPSHTHTHPMDSLRQMSPCSFALALQSPAANSCKIFERTVDSSINTLQKKQKKIFDIL